MSYIGNSPGVASQRVETAFTATSSQTVFTPSSGYTLGYCDVYQNGVKLVNGDDYTASDGATVTLATGAASGDSIVIVASFPRGLSDGYLKSEADARYPLVTDSTATANGVLYRNGSKVLTAGSALVVDGTNIGLGVTPSAWSLVQPAIQFGTAGAFISGQGVNPWVGVGSNGHYNGTNWIYKVSNTSGAYFINGSIHEWRIAGVGTAGNTISYTQAMTLDNAALGSTYSSLCLSNTTGGGVVFQQSGTAKMSIFNAGNDGYIDRNNAAGKLFFRNTANGTTDATLDASGNFGLATASPDSAYKLTVQRTAGGSGNVLLQGDNTTVGLPSIVYKNTNGGATAYLGFNGENVTAKGIAFPATQSASSNANTLDDYEEGTWTPLCGDNSTAITDIKKAVYTKIGKLVTIELDCTCNSTYPGSGNYLYGLPFAGGNGGAGNGGGCAGYSGGGIVYGFHVTSNTTALYFWNPIADAVLNLAGRRIIFSFSYTTSS